jgi:phytol kinase
VTQRDVMGLVYSYVYAFALLGIVEGLGRAFKWRTYLTRKIIHIGAGLWVWGILYFFDTWYIGLIPFATFIVLNFIFYRFRIFQAMDDEEATPGTVYFAISITLLFGLLWRKGLPGDHAPEAVAAVMAMTIGDAMASIVGKSSGKQKYTIMGHTRTFEGTWAMASFTFVAILATLMFLPGSFLSSTTAHLNVTALVVAAVLGTVVATLAEAVTPHGLDNLSVPLLTGLVLYILQRLA